MRQLLFIFLLISNIAFAQVDISTNFNVNAPLPMDSRDTTATIATRNALESVKRWEGMDIYVYEDSTSYQLVGGTLNGNWQKIHSTDFDSLSIRGNTIRFNESEGVFEFETGNADVVWQGPLEDLTIVYNNSGSLMTNGSVVYFNSTSGDSIPTIALASNLDNTGLAAAGLVTVDIPNNEWGFIANRGFVRFLNTTGLSTTRVEGVSDNIVYLGVTGNFLDEAPPPPAQVIAVGVAIRAHATDGVVLVEMNNYHLRDLRTRDYTFTSQGVGAGTYYLAGDYDWAAADANLTQALPTTTYGTVNDPHGKHAGVVTGGAGTVDTGVVGLRLTGDSYDDALGITVADADTIITDITSVAINEYYEGKKWVGQVTFELIVMSGAPTTYSLDFNYGFSKYEDSGNNDFYVIDVEMIMNASSTDTDFDIELIHHNTIGWTYAATGFTPGGGTIASWSGTYGPNDNVINGNSYAWKVTEINELILGEGSHGVLFRIITGAANTVQSLDVHLGQSLSNP
jgi:hypothetical protein